MALIFRFTQAELDEAVKERIRALRESQRLMRESTDAHEESEATATESACDDFNVQEQSAVLTRMHKHLAPADVYEMDTDEFLAFFRPIRL